MTPPSINYISYSFAVHIETIAARRGGCQWLVAVLHYIIIQTIKLPIVAVVDGGFPVSTHSTSPQS